MKKGIVKAKEKKSSPSLDFQIFDEHPDHDRHLCHMVNIRNLKTVAKLAQDPKHICFICGRTAKSEKNICEPYKI